MKVAIFMLSLTLLMAFVPRNQNNLQSRTAFAPLMQNEKLLLDTVFNLSTYADKFKGVKEHGFKKTISTENNASVRIESTTLVKNPDNSVVKRVKVFLTKPVKGHTFYAAMNEAGQINQGSGDNDKTYVMLEIWSNTKTVERAFSKMYTVDSDGKIEVVTEKKISK